MAAEVIGGALLKVLFKRLDSPPVLAYFKGIPTAKLGELEAVLRSALLLLNDAEKRLNKERLVKEWVDDLTQTVYDAEDLIYKINTKALRNQQKISYTTQVKALLPSSSKKAIKGKMDEIIAKLKYLRKNNPNLLLVYKQALPERLPAPLVIKSDVYGRDADTEAIVQMLLSDDADSGANKLTVIPIVGMGGIGKTTLAQLVFDDERVKSNFKCKAWFTIGDGEVDYSEVMRRIIKEVSPEECKTEDSRVLQMKLREALMGKKFLFILDDFWDENQGKWDLLHNDLGSGLQGSKVIVTTRSTNVASNMKTRSTPYNLGVLSNDDGWLLFSHHAFIDANSKEHSDLEVIGKEIVAKCEGLPLAIRSLASLLRCKRTKEEWDDILNSDLWELHERKDILPALWLSYYHLPSELKPCFAFCALFPKDYRFEKEKIILMWMAEGFLHPKSGERMEEVGEEYFQDLISRSFFQPWSEEIWERFLMHDLMHDLAIFVSGELCLEMDDTKFFNCTHKIRHLAYKGGADDAEKFESLSKAKGLRTFLAFPERESGKAWSQKMGNLFESLSHGKNFLRVLSVTENCEKADRIITRIPDSIGDLKYLKYLEINWIRIEEIPNSICNLYNLETLLLVRCSMVKRLPVGIGNLINLRHLLIPYSLEEMPLQIGKMKKLQTLNRFVVGECSIKHLKELRDLHGTLQIDRLENVGSVEDALEAELKNKKFLKELILSWSRNSGEPDDLQKESDILGVLEPHKNLKKLYIDRYRGSSFPNWIGNPSLSNLVDLSLCYCRKCSFLPPLGQLPSLKDLRILGFDDVERIGSEFYYSTNAEVNTRPFTSLETLRLEDVSDLQEWSFIEGQVFPRLKKLFLGGCRKLKVSLPDSLPSLTEFKIVNCDQLLPLVSETAVDVAFPSLKSLTIGNCDKQDSVLEGGLPSSLKKIEIYGCSNLTALDEETFQHLTSLEKLYINCCPNLRCLPKELPASLSHLRIEGCHNQDSVLEGGLPSSLKKIEIYECSNLTALDEETFQHLTSLEELDIAYCPNLRCLPKELPASLSHLRIEDCDLLTPRLKRETGEDWPIIAHIPNLEIFADEDEDSN